MTARLNAWALAALAILTLLRLVLAARLPLAPDEAYYVLWSRHLQAGYFDHPPMVAFWIRAGTLLLGNTPLGIRLGGPLAGAVGSLLVWRAGEDFWPGRQAGLVAAALLNATLMVGVGAIVMTPDTPLFFFWTAGVAALGRLAITGRRRWWLAVGAAAGAALLSKYTGLLFIAGIGAWLLATIQGRAALTTLWPWAGAATALLIFLPNLLWNADHGWVSLLKQGSRTAGFEPARAAQYFAELCAGQIGLATPIIFILIIFGVWRLGPAHPLLWLTVIPGLVFLEHVVSGRVQANWPAVLYPSGCLAAAASPLPRLRRWFGPALGLGLTLTALTYDQALGAPFPLPPRTDPTALQFAGWGQLAADAQNAAARQHAAFITSDEYATAAEIALRRGGVDIIGYDRRWSYFGFLPARPGAVGVLVTRRRDTACPEQLGEIFRDRRGAIIATFKICRFVAPSGSVILPRP